MGESDYAQRLGKHHHDRSTVAHRRDRTETLAHPPTTGVKISQACSEWWWASATCSPSGALDPGLDLMPPCMARSQQPSRSGRQTPYLIPRHTRCRQHPPCCPCSPCLLPLLPPLPPLPLLPCLPCLPYLPCCSCGLAAVLPCCPAIPATPATPATLPPLLPLLPLLE
jgi:hypothetical protein